MTEKVRKDAVDLKTKTRIIMTVAVITVVFGILYAACRIIGGEYKEFAQAAAVWVFFGIGIAGALSYLSAMEESQK